MVPHRGRRGLRVGFRGRGGIVDEGMGRVVATDVQGTHGLLQAIPAVLGAMGSGVVVRIGGVGRVVSRSVEGRVGRRADGARRNHGVVVGERGGGGAEIAVQDMVGVGIGVRGGTTMFGEVCGRAIRFGESGSGERGDMFGDGRGGGGGARGGGGVGHGGGVSTRWQTWSGGSVRMSEGEEDGLTNGYEESGRMVEDQRLGSGWK